MLRRIFPDKTATINIARGSRKEYRNISSISVLMMVDLKLVLRIRIKSTLLLADELSYANTI